MSKIDVPDEELNGAEYLVIGRDSTDRHGLVVFDAFTSLPKATTSANGIAKNFPGKPIFLFKLIGVLRADIVVNSEAPKVKRSRS